jgi:hypothetical protein
MVTVIELARKLRFPSPPEQWQNDTSTKLRLLTRSLRNAYYDACPKRKVPYSTPFGGRITESIGPWPEFILRGLPCQKSKRGCCTPCFYSRLPQVDLPRREVYKSLIEQTRYILQHFESLVLRNQQGPV